MPAAWLVLPPRGLSIEVIEDGIERQIGPFHDYVRPEVRDRVAARERGINRAPRTDITPEHAQAQAARTDRRPRASVKTLPSGRRTAPTRLTESLAAAMVYPLGF